MRNLYGPKINPADYALPVGKGGTGRMLISEAADALQLVKNSAKGQPNGPIALGSNGQIDVTKLPVLVGTNQVNLIGNFSPSVNSTTTWQISDYDSFKTYSASASAGTLTRNGDTFTYVAPATPQVVTLSIAGRSIPITITGPLPGVPSIVSPVEGSSNLPSAGVNIVSSAYSAPSDGSAHASSDWQVATDSAFTNIVSASIDDVANKTSWTTSALSVSTTYFVRVRHRAVSGVYSNYSPVVSFTTSGNTFLGVEEAKLQASDGNSSNRFGYSVAMDSSGNRVVIGAPGTVVGGNTTGAAYVFVRSGTTWSQEAKLAYTGDVQSGQNFGGAVAIFGDGSHAIVSAYSANSSGVQIGRVLVFVRSGTTWTLEQAFNATSTANGASLQFGWSLSVTLDGSRLVIGDRQASKPDGSGGFVTTGAAYVFVRSGSTYAQESKLQPTSNSAQEYGFSVAISQDGLRMVVGGSGGAVVYVYTRSGVNWTLEGTLAGTGDISTSLFGYSVALSSDGTRVIVGAPNATGPTTTSGAAYVFVRNTTTNAWTQEQKIVGSDITASGFFGCCVAFLAGGAKAYVGRYNETATGGSVYVFTRSGSTWTQQAKITASTVVGSGRFGTGVSISYDGSRMVVGAPTSSTTVGSAYIER